MGVLGHLHVERSGAGAPGLVLTHGIGDDLHVWDALAPLLAPRHEVACWDLRSHGRSGHRADPRWYGRDLAVDDLDRVAATVPVPPVLVGHSLGGYLSLTHALRHPGRAAALVLVAAGPGFRDPAGRERWNASMDRLVARLGMPPQSAGLAHMHDDLVISGLASIRVPVLLVLGADDARFEPGVRVLAAKLPRAQLLVVDGAGHDVHRTHAPQVATAVEALLSTLPGRAPRAGSGPAGT